MPGWLQPWIATIQWIGTSPYRPEHRRKNWFVGVSVLEQPDTTELNLTDVRMDTFRASGPGGQNVNKIESAVRLTHVPSGISVVAREARSQRENRLLALERLKRRLQSEHEDSKADLRRQFRNQHSELVRGNAIRVYSGTDFRRIR
jgi:peptide chain release factor